MPCRPAAGAALGALAAAPIPWLARPRGGGGACPLLRASLAPPPGTPQHSGVRASTGAAMAMAALCVAQRRVRGVGGMFHKHHWQLTHQQPPGGPLARTAPPPCAWTASSPLVPGAAKRTCRAHLPARPPAHCARHNPMRLDRALHWMFWQRLLGSGVLTANASDADWWVGGPAERARQQQGAQRMACLRIGCGACLCVWVCMCVRGGC